MPYGMFPLVYNNLENRTNKNINQIFNFTNLYRILCSVFNFMKYKIIKKLVYIKYNKLRRKQCNILFKHF